MSQRAAALKMAKLNCQLGLHSRLKARPLSADKALPSWCSCQGGATGCSREVQLLFLIVCFLAATRRGRLVRARLLSTGAKSVNAPFGVFAAPEQPDLLSTLGSCWASWQGHLRRWGALCAPCSSKCGDFAGVVKGACPLLVALCVVVTL